MKVIADNRNAFRLYEIEEKLEAGIQLLGDEVKSVRNNAVSLKEGYARVRKGELFLINVNISEYGNSSLAKYNPKRDRRLLVHKKEINRLAGLQERQGYTIVPLQVYFKGNKVKVEIGLGKGKRKYDKRDDIKKREAKRDIDRAMKKNKQP
ncbi:MAG: SsrA-binding protein SmpB [bacterium]|nr:SsrA-binding protein SmpB [bacterium]